MKPRHVESYRINARALFEMWNISPSQDFHTLSSEQIDTILKEADRVGYQKPKHANGSRARYFYQMWQRRAG
jgi:hypothetical protein